jgi:hypothetical protein
MVDSNADKRSVTTDALQTLGTIIGAGEKRDAIHLAVDPAIAGENLIPGEDVGLVNGVAVKCDRPLGIVDPFLKASVKKGERFWLVVYPRQITSLRHVWSHPAFPEEPEFTPEQVGFAREVAMVLGKDPSLEWIETFAAKVGVTYKDLMKGAKEWVQHEDYLVRGGLLEGEHVPDEFWDHYEAVTGETVPTRKRESFFSCSC